MGELDGLTGQSATNTPVTDLVPPPSIFPSEIALRALAEPIALEDRYSARSSQVVSLLFAGAGLEQL
ncbi:MAG: hypothetical protein HC890_01630 [Chloroflexaceae bacterium]|nr:hypothetical protein [Chloroflexaceae bacterium]